VDKVDKGNACTSLYKEQSVLAAALRESVVPLLITTKKDLFMPYQSEAERLFHADHPHLTLINDSLFDATITDAEGVKTRFKLDFYCKETNTYYEIKSRYLNSMKTKNESDKKIQAVHSFKGYLKQIDKLRYQWCHSRFKQALVQDVVTSKGYKFVVVFFKCKLSKAATNKMDLMGLNYTIIA